jgi:hypothetical protein
MGQEPCPNLKGHVRLRQFRAAEAEFLKLQNSPKVAKRVACSNRERLPVSFFVPK